jgi:hypothetical protein
VWNRLNNHLQVVVSMYAQKKIHTSQLSLWRYLWNVV